MNDTFTGLLLVTISLLCLAAYLTVWRALFAERVTALLTVAAATPLRAFVIGLINLTFFGVVALALASIAGQGGPAALLWLPVLIAIACLVVALSFGLSAFAQTLGERLLPEATRARQSLIGALLLIAASMLPVAGWLVLFPFVACVGVGAFVMGIARRA
jgi:hypothetical protein